MESSDRITALTRLLELVCTLANRVAAGFDDQGIGKIFALAQQGAHLARGLGLSNPPLELIRYDRDSHDGPAHQPWAAPVFRHCPPELSKVLVLRLHDPLDAHGTGVADILAAGVTDGDDSPAPRMAPLWDVLSKRDARARILEVLRRWERRIENVLIPAERATAQGRASEPEAGG